MTIHEDETCYVDSPVTGWQKTDGGCFNDQGSGTTESTIIDPVSLLERLAAHNAARLESRKGDGTAEVDTWSYSYSDPIRSPGRGAWSRPMPAASPWRPRHST